MVLRIVPENTEFIHWRPRQVYLRALLLNVTLLCGVAYADSTVSQTDLNVLSCAGGASSDAGTSTTSISSASGNSTTEATSGSSSTSTCSKPSSAQGGSWKGTNVQAGYVANTGNTNSSNFNAAGNLVYTNQPWTYTETTTYQRQEASGVVSANLFYTQGRAQYALGEKNYVYGQASYTDNQFDAYVYVYNENIGYGRYLPTSASMSWSVFLGPGLQQTEATQAAGGQAINEPSMQVGTAYSWKINTNVTYNFNEQTQFSGQNIHSMLTTGITVALVKHLSLSVNYQVTDDTKPLDGKVPLNTMTAIQLGYNF